MRTTAASQMGALFERAAAAGRAAAEATVPRPMVVTAGRQVVQVIEAGPCGFAWITIRPGTSAAARYAKAALGARSSRSEGGVVIWVFGYGQSIALKERYAEAFAEVLRAGGVQAYAGSRMD